MGPRTARGVCQNGGGYMRGADTCEHGLWGLRWSSPWGHDPRERRAKVGVYQRRGRMRTRPLGPSVELPKGHEPCEGCAKFGAADACERGRWGLRWSSLWGHDPREGSAEMGAGTRCACAHRDRRRSSLCGRDPREGALKWTCGEQGQGEEEGGGGGNWSDVRRCAALRIQSEDPSSTGGLGNT